MVVRIRLARHGQRNSPFYHIVAINSSKRRDARPLEKLGEYDPIPRIPSSSSLPSSSKVFGSSIETAPREKRVEWNVDRIRYWLGVGAQPSKPVVKLLERGGVLTVPHKWQHQYSPTLPSTSQSTSPTPSSNQTQPAESQETVQTAAGDLTGFEGKTAS